MPDAQKLSVALSLLATGRMVRFLLVPSAPEVVVPAHLKEQEFLGLDFGRRAPTPIDDLKCDSSGISGTLRFGDEYFWCSVPWAAVMGISPIGPTPSQRAWNPVVLDGGKN